MPRQSKSRRGNGVIGRLAAIDRAELSKRFNPAAFLATAGVGKKVLDFRPKQMLFSQGAPADSVFYLQKGRVRLTVVSKAGKEATVALLGPGDFAGEGCITGPHPVRLTTASAMTPCTVMRISRDEMLRVLHEEHEFSDLFTAFLLARNARIQDDLIDQLFNSSEKRLARILLLLAQFGKPGKPETVIPKVSHQMLAQMIGTTRSRVTFFLNRFRKLGFIDYNGEMQVHNSLLNIILHD